jgi:hypothetical protein
VTENKNLIEPGMRVTWNETGEKLFGKTDNSALVTGIDAVSPGHTGPAAHLLWESGQETWASLSCLKQVEE